jgi:DNA (cytosine-5)-methyltransferase 1
LTGLFEKPFESATVRYDVPFPPPRNPKFRFIDLFAGIGGMRIAFQNLGGQCVFSSEIDPFAKQTYQANFGEVPFGDITRIEAEDIPKHDVLVGGFPCQAFSIAGKRLGFEETRGTLFYDIARILAVKRPKAFLLENVKGLMNHRGGETLRVILKILRDELKYIVPDPQIVNAKYFGVPQNRERVIIVGFRESKDANGFRYPEQKDVSVFLKQILEREPVQSKYYVSSQYYQALKNHRSRHESKGNGFGYEILDENGVSNAIVVGGMGRERNLIVDHRILDKTPTTRIVGEVNSDDVRRLTPREWARLQGFPDQFVIPVSDAQAYKQFGNSVAIPAIESVAKRVIKRLLVKAPSTKLTKSKLTK